MTNLNNAKNKIYEININKEDKEKKQVKINYKDLNNNILTIMVSNYAFNNKGIFCRELGELKCKNYQKIFNKYKFNNECKLQYDRILKKYYLLVTIEKDKIDKKNTYFREKFVACDPGEKIFQSIYSNKRIANLGVNMRDVILKYRNRISKLQSILKKDKNRKGNKIRNKNKIKKTIQKLNNKIKNYVNEIHKKTAKYLCLNYENILIPEFRTQNIISKKKISEKEKEIENEKDKKKQIQLKRNLKKTNRLNEKVKYVLQSQSHYRFRRYLKNLAERYRSTVIVVDESYTSKTCTYCGKASDEYDKNRIKTCNGCNKKIDRDENGSRNIFIKILKKIKFGENQISKRQMDKISNNHKNV